MENHLHQCIYDILLSDITEPAKLTALQRYKAKIVGLHARRKEKVMLDNDAQDKMEDEEPSLFHILKMAKQHETRFILQILDKQSKNVSGHLKLLMPNDEYSGRTAPLTSKRCILYIYSTHIGTEYFKHCIYCNLFLFG